MEITHYNQIEAWPNLYLICINGLWYCYDDDVGTHRLLTPKQ